MSKTFIIETGSFKDNIVDTLELHLTPRSFDWSGSGPNIGNICPFLHHVVDRVTSVVVKPEYRDSDKGDYVTATTNGQNSLLRYVDVYLGSRLQVGDNIEEGVEVDSSQGHHGYITWHYNKLCSTTLRVLNFEDENSGTFAQMGLADIPEHR